MISRAINIVWYASCLSRYKNFLNNMSDVRSKQTEILLSMIHRNTDTLFGRAHGFKDIQDYETYRKNVPLMCPDEYIPFLDEISKGQRNVLTKEDVFLLEPTGGSSGGTKFIPYNASLKEEFLSAICPWVVNMMRAYPGLAKGRSYWTITPKISSESGDDSVIPVGFDDDFEYFGSIGKILRYNAVIPNAISEITDRHSFQHITACCLLSAHDLSFVSVWNPSVFTLFLEYAENFRDEVIKGVHDGIQGFVRPSRQRAKTVEACLRLDVSQRYASVWKQLSLISCWMDGASSVHVSKLRTYFPAVAFQNKGLLATEGVMTIPWVESGGNVPAYTSHFFEFVHSATGSVVLIDELLEHEEYTVVLTTGSGLYRYNMGDRVKVEGFYKKLPVLKFIGREKVSDLVGEKLDYVFVSRAIESVMKALRIESDFVMLSPEVKGNGGQYILYIQVEGSDQDYNLADLRTALESRLMDNFHYRHALDLNQLQPLKICVVRDDAKQIYVNRCVDEGQKLGDVKSSYLDGRQGWSEYFQGEFLNI